MLGTAIQALIDAIPQGGGVVRLQSGEHEASEPLMIPSNVTLCGEGATTILVSSSPTFAVTIIGRVLTTTTITQNIVGGGGVGTQNPTITVADATGFVAGQFVRVTKDNAVPLKTEFNSVLSVMGNTITFGENFIENYSVTDGVKIVAVEPVRNASVRDLAIRGANPQTHAIWATDTSYLSLRRLSINGIARKGIHVKHSHYPRISDNRLSGNGTAPLGDWGLRSDCGMGAIVQRNTLVNAGALVVNGDLSTLVNGNMIDSTGPTGGDGISVISTVGSIISGNRILRPKCYGIWLHHSCSRNVISQNQISSGVTAGIYVSDDSDDNLLSGNVITRNNGGGIGIGPNCERNIISGNVITENKGNGIYAGGNTNVIADNTVRANTGAQIAWPASSVNTYRDNITT